MNGHIRIDLGFLALLAVVGLVSACSAPGSSARPESIAGAVPSVAAPAAVSAPSVSPTTPRLIPARSAVALFTPTVPAPPATPTTTGKPTWFNIPLTDALTGDTFTVGGLSGNVVLIEMMAEWCPGCVSQQYQVKLMADSLKHRPDLAIISMDEELNEDAASLKEYAAQYGFDWRFVAAPLEVDRALGNLYSAEYLNPPLDPMLIIDRHGSVYGLPFGRKHEPELTNTLQEYLE